MANTIGLQAIIDVTQFNQGLRLYIKGMLDMTSATQNASSQINRLGVAASAGVGAALGTTAVNAVQSLVGALGNMATAIGENVSNFEGLAISLNFFAARALQEVSPMPLQAALEATQVQAQGLMLWVERLATLSPFTAEQVGNAFRTAQAYGLSLAAAQKLVPLLVDFAAVNKLSPELLQRVALAMAQIQARGKLAAQEINQLANAGLPIRDLLKKSLDVSGAALEKLLEDGLIPASAAIQAVTGYLEGFEGAAERVTRGTLQGIISSLQDLRDISSRDIFGPMIKAFFPLLNQLIDIGNSTHFKAGVKVIGNELGEGLAVRIRLATTQVLLLAQSFAQVPQPVLQATAIFAGLSIVLVGFTATVGLLAAAIALLINPFTIVIAVIAGFVAAYSTNFRGLRDITVSVTANVSSAFTSMSRVISTVVNSVLTVISSATSSIGDLANTVISYGEAVVQAFVSGIVGALGLLTDAMQLIGGVVSFWLQPGSPPRAIPNLDRWGTETANVWLKGWLSADFGILSGIASDVGNVLTSLVSAGQLDELAAPRILLALRTQLAGAVDEFRKFGSVSQSTLNDVAKSAGPAANQVKELLKGYVALAVETKIVAEAQEKLSAITERYSAILDPLRKKLSDISELRQQADEQKELLSLQRLIANAGVGHTRKEAARFRIQEIMLNRQVRGIEGKKNAEETAAEAEIKSAQKRKTIAEEQLERTKALIEIQNEQLNLYGQELQILEKIRKEQERLAREARQKMLEQLKKQLEIAQLLQAELKDAVGVFKAQFTLADGTATAAEKAAASLELQAILGRRIVRNFEAMELGIDPSQIQAIRDTLITLADIGIKGSPFEGMEADIFGVGEDTTKLVDEMNAAMQDIRGMFRETREEIDGFLEGINNMLPGFLKFRKAVVGSDTSLSDNLRTTRASTDEFNKWPPLLQTLATAFSGVATGLITSRVLTTLPKLLLGLTGPVGIITALVSTLASAWVGDWFNIRQVTADSIAFITEKFNQFVNSTRWEQFALDASTSITAVSGFFVELGNRVRGVFVSIINPILQKGFSFETVLESLALLRTQIRAHLLLINGDISEEAKAIAQNIGSNVSDFLNQYWNPFLAILLLSSRTVLDIIVVVFQEIGKQFSFLPRLAGVSLRAVLSLTGQALLKILPLVGTALSPISNLILKTLGGLGQVIAAAIFLPIKLLGKTIDLNAIISPIVNSFSNGFAKKILVASPKMWSGLITGLIKMDAFIGQTLVSIFTGALNMLRNLGRGYLGVFKFLDDLTFAGFRFFTQAGFAIPKVFAAMGSAIKIFGGVATNVLLFVADIILSLVAIDYKPFFDFFNRIKPTATATMPILAELFDLTRAALTRLSGAFAPAYAAFKSNLLPIFTSAAGASSSFLGNITKIGAAIGGKFVTVFQQFKTVGPAVAAAFKGLSQGLGKLSLIGSIKILDFFEGLSKGILSFAGKGQTKLGAALAGIFQGAFKGIGKGLLNIPSLFGSLFKGFSPGGLIKGIASVFGSVKKISGAFGGLLNPINLLISALDFFGFAFTHNIDGVKNRAVGFVTAIKSAWADLISGKMWANIQSGFTKAFAVITAIWTEFQTNGINSPKLREMLLEIGTNFIDWARETGTNILTSLREFWLPVFGIWVRESIENLGTTLGQVAIFLRDWIVIIGGFLGTEIGKAWTFFWTWWNDQGGAEKTGEWLQNIIDIVWGWIKTSAAFIKTNFIDNWLPAFTDWVNEGGITRIVEQLAIWAGGVMNWILTIGLPLLVNTLLSWGTALLGWIGPALADGIVALAGFLGGLITWIIGTGIPLLVTGVFGLISALIGWIAGTGDDTAEKKVPTELEKFLSAIGTFITRDILPALLEAGKTMAQAIWDGFKQLWAEIIENEATTEFEKFLTKVQKNILAWRNGGKELGDSMWDGVQEGVAPKENDPAQASLNDALKKLIRGGADEVEARSPSQLAKRMIGDMIAEGIIEGITGIDETALFDTAKLVDDLYFKVTTATDLLITTLTTSFTTFSAALIVILTDLNAKSFTLWDDIRFDAIDRISVMRSTILEDVSAFSITLQTSMTAIKDIIVGAFTLANTESVKQVSLLASHILGVLVGQGENDKNSITFQIKTAMDTAGRMVGKAFVDGIVFVFGDQETLNPLWMAIDTLVANILARFQSGLSTINPMGTTDPSIFTSSLDSRPGTFMPSNVTNISRNQEMNLIVNSTATSQGIISDYAVLRTMLR